MYDVTQKMAAHFGHIHLENEHTVGKWNKKHCENEKWMFKFDKCIRKDMFYMIN